MLIAYSEIVQRMQTVPVSSAIPHLRDGVLCDRRIFRGLSVENSRDVCGSALANLNLSIAAELTPPTSIPAIRLEQVLAGGQHDFEAVIRDQQGSRVAV